MDPAVMIADPRPADADDDAEAVLVVDLDGTLCRTDTLHETLLRLAAADPRAMPGMALGLRGGKVRFKNAIADRMVIDPATLGYDPAVIEALERARAAGRRTALVSAEVSGEAATQHLFVEVSPQEPMADAESIDAKSRCTLVADGYLSASVFEIAAVSVVLPWST
jgi:hypothetical protein